MTKWKTFRENGQFGEDKTYLVRWINYDGEPQRPMLAYWVIQENSFFLSHCDYAWPVRVDEYMEIEE